MSATEKRIAFHEAAHAVVARLRGVEITTFDLELAGRGSTGRVQTRSRAWVVERDGGDAATMMAALEADAAVAVAGMISELVRRPRALSLRAMSQGRSALFRAARAHWRWRRGFGRLPSWDENLDSERIEPFVDISALFAAKCPQ